LLQQIGPDDIAVYEMSSFQLWDVERSPHIAVVLGIEPDHLDIHRGYDDYVTAKSHIALYQQPDDTIIYKPSNPESSRIAPMSAAKHHVSFGEGGDVTVRDGAFWYRDQRVCDTTAVVIPGAHNLENACAAIAASWQYVQDGETIARGLSAFHGLPHHIERVREHQGVTYYDDSFSASSTATIVAVRAFPNPLVLIAGGFDRGLDFAQMAHDIAAEAEHVRHVVLMGQTAPKIGELLSQNGFRDFDILTTTDFEQIVRRAVDLAQPGDVVLLSPGCPSFDMFKNFYERGDRFKSIVEAL
jgi:UDP-N-acetylmuramoylalanine--D-glutamate ligase